MDRIRVYTGGVASCNGYLFKTRDNTYVAVDAPSGFADWIYSKKPDIIITDLLITHQHFDHVEDACRMRQIFDCRIHAGQPYNESLTLEKWPATPGGFPSMFSRLWWMKYLLRTFTRRTGAVCCGISTRCPAILRTALFTICRMKESCLLVTSFCRLHRADGPPGGNLRLLKQGIEKKVLNQPATTMISQDTGLIPP